MNWNVTWAKRAMPSGSQIAMWARRAIGKVQVEDSVTTLPKQILLLGLLCLVALLVKALFRRIKIPALIGYIAIGFSLCLVNTHWYFLTPDIRRGLELLAELGLVALLFRVGLGSDVAGLARQLRRASVVWLGDVLVSGLFGYLAATYLLGLPLIPTLFVTVAFTATSVAVLLSIWQEAGATRSPSGELLIDVAELDDISAIVLMALLFAVAPALRSGEDTTITHLATSAAGPLTVKLILFGGVCLLFARYAELPLTRFLRSVEAPPDRMLSVAAIGVVTAAVATLIGFSFALGAFFAGLTFSRDPKVATIIERFGVLYSTFTPFFFIGIGLALDPAAVTSAATLGLVLFVAASLGKLTGAGLPTWAVAGGNSALLIGVSMLPRAEIAMVVMQRGRQLGEWAVPASVFGGMVVVSALSCVLTPLALRPLLRRQPWAED